MDRRVFLIGLVFLAGCQSTGGVQTANREVTAEFDGRYQIVVSRVPRKTPANIAHIQRVGSGPESLATLLVEVTGGEMKLLSKADSSGGNNYEDLSGNAFQDGHFDISMTAGFLKGQRSPYKLRVAGLVGEDLLKRGETTVFPNGFDADFQAHVNIRKL